ncbi:protein ALTERED PHOSPHATE STARVATION RESPONSE 1-like [Phragmites australis]|uniref:protein ALTERED PHOSPHATE STARVATION RESPONSE 1-like n=1 Tax=Phragmites australis TaxID=29695 RepID=UPI002D77B098|nr:protein ALTERED PHOSPHATE STARVATION RESPONSE 1-like [Phragmites australis]
MGCGLSKEDAEGGAVSRCRERKHLLRSAVQARHALSGAHAGHAAALRNVGAALSDYAAGESAHHDVGGGGVVVRSASASATVPGAVKTLPSPLDSVLLPPPPPPGAGDGDPAPLVRSMSAPDLPLQQPIRKGHSGEAPIIEEEGEGDVDDARRREEDVQPPPPPPPAHAPPPTRSPPPVPPPETEDRKPALEGNSWDEFIFGSRDAMPVLPPTLDPSAAESSWAAERREPAPPPSPAPEQPPPPQPPVTVAEDVDEGKKPAAEPGARRSATQKAARKGEGKKGRTVVMVPPQPARLGDVLRRLDDHFLKASESAHEVSKMLEAARMHYHSNFAETRGFVDHSARVIQVITWNRSFKGIPQPENVKNELDDDEWETHATILDKLLAWEKKLYHEVKEFEVIKMTYQRKLAVLNKKKQRGVSSSSIEKTKSVVSHLHTKYIVDLQTMESTVAEINRLRDQQLYPKLLELVKGMAHMWDVMYLQHKAQLRIISELKSFDISVAARETSDQHHERTVQLWNIVHEWHTQFDKFMTYQKQYVGSLYSWIKLNVIPIDANLKPNSSQPHETTPPIKRLLHAWHDILGKLPDEATKKAINTFAEVINTILVHQVEEMKLKIKIEETRREHERKRRQFDDWARKNWDRGAGIVPEGSNPDGARADPVVEREAAVDRLEHALKDLEEKYRTQCRVVKDKSLNLLRTNLPELFHHVSDFSLQSAGMFKSVWSIAHTNDQLDE